MVELPQKSGAHSAKHERNPSALEVHGSEATIKFSPAILSALQQLHGLALAHGDKNFDEDAAYILRGMAYGETMPLEQTLSCLVAVCSEAGECYAKTGDLRVHQALESVEYALHGVSQEGVNVHPTILTIKAKAKGRA